MMVALKNITSVFNPSELHKLSKSNFRKFWTSSVFLKGRRVSKQNCWSPLTTSVPKWVIHNEAPKPVWMVCICLNTLRDMWFSMSFVRALCQPIVFEGISRMGTLPSRCVSRGRSSKAKQNSLHMYLLLVPHQDFLLYIKPIYIQDPQLWEQLGGSEVWSLISGWCCHNMIDWKKKKKKSVCHRLQCVRFQFQKVYFIYWRQQTTLYACQVGAIISTQFQQVAHSIQAWWPISHN